MANPKGNPQNLQPVRTKEEAKKRGAAGGKKSGASRRKKRDARQAIRYVLDMAATGKLDEKLEGLGFDEEDRTNMTGLTVAMMMRAASGDVSAASTRTRSSRNERARLASLRWKPLQEETLVCWSPLEPGTMVRKQRTPSSICQKSKRAVNDHGYTDTQATAWAAGAVPCIFRRYSSLRWSSRRRKDLWLAPVRPSV